MNPAVCVRCKGRLWCGLNRCPIIEAARNTLPKLKLSGNSIFGASPPSVFVGRKGYPYVYAGPLISEEKVPFISTSELFGKSLNDVLSSTATLIRTAKKVNVRKFNEKIIEASQEIAMSERSVDTEIWVEKYYGGATVDEFFHPTGPRIQPRKIVVAENPVIPNKVDSVIEERLKAETAIQELYFYGYDVDYLQRLMAAGVMGKSRRMVPTRWSITAIDDIASRALLKKVKQYDTIDAVEYRYAAYMGNEFHIFLIPGSWEYEMLESWMKGSIYSGGWSVGVGDYEPYSGRKNYADNVTGAYYSARLGVVEYLAKIRRQAKIIVYREITSDYKLPLGVWVIRETVRYAMRLKPVKFSSIEEALNAAKTKMHNAEWISKSRILYNLHHQRKLEDYF